MAAPSSRCRTAWMVVSEHVYWVGTYYYLSSVYHFTWQLYSLLYQKEFVMAQRLLQLIITAKESHNLITMIAIIWICLWLRELVHSRYHWIDEYLRSWEREREVKSSRTGWSRATCRIHVNRFGVIPKSHQPGKWRLIVDLSYTGRAGLA